MVKIGDHFLFLIGGAQIVEDLGFQRGDGKEMREGGEMGWVEGPFFLVLDFLGIEFRFGDGSGFDADHAGEDSVGVCPGEENFEFWDIGCGDAVECCLVLGDNDGRGCRGEEGFEERN